MHVFVNFLKVYYKEHCDILHQKGDKVKAIRSGLTNKLFKPYHKEPRDTVIFWD